MKPVLDLEPGDIVRLDGDDVAELDTKPSPRGGNDFRLIAWMKGDKLPVYFEPGEVVEVLPQIEVEWMPVVGRWVHCDNCGRNLGWNYPGSTCQEANYKTCGGQS